MHVLLILIALLQPVAAMAQSVSSLRTLEPLGGRIESDARTARLTLFDQLIIFDYGSPFFRAGRDVYQLVAPARANAQVSAEFFTEWLPRRFPDKLSLQNGSLRLATQPVAVRPAPGKPQTPAQQPARPQPVNPARKEERVVVIDAGHGGRDPGKIGPTGLAEKIVTLSVATKLGALLRDRGYEVHLTRASDTLIALADRPRLANQWKNGRPATLFVSIHANAGVAKAQGYETYFLSEARTEDERRVAEMENAAVSFEEKPAVRGPAIDLLLTGLRNDYYQRASNDFAEVIQRELGAFHPGPNRGVKQAGFRVLVGAVMPAVLVEIAFISNPEEARLLGSAAFQDKIAWSLARSIGNFFDSHQHLWATQ